MRAVQILTYGKKIIESQSYLIIKYSFKNNTYGSRHYLFKKVGLKTICCRLLNTKSLEQYFKICQIENERFRNKNN